MIDCPFFIQDNQWIMGQSKSKEGEDGTGKDKTEDKKDEVEKSLPPVGMIQIVSFFPIFKKCLVLS